MIGFVTLLYALGAPAPPPQQDCARQIKASVEATRLSELPSEIVEDLQRSNGGAVADSDATLLRTDAPGAKERGHVEARFYRGYKVGDQWFVQVEVALFEGVRTMAYRYSHADRMFRREPWKYYAGPSCGSIKASLAGVMTPGSR